MSARGYSDTEPDFSGDSESDYEGHQAGGYQYQSGGYRTYHQGPPKATEGGLFNSDWMSDRARSCIPDYDYNKYTNKGKAVYEVKVQLDGGSDLNVVSKDKTGKPLANGILARTKKTAVAEAIKEATKPEPAGVHEGIVTVEETEAQNPRGHKQSAKLNNTGFLKSMYSFYKDNTPGFAYVRVPGIALGDPSWEHRSITVRIAADVEQIGTYKKVKYSLGNPVVMDGKKGIAVPQEVASAALNYVRQKISGRTIEGKNIKFETGFSPRLSYLIIKGHGNAHTPQQAQEKEARHAVAFGRAPTEPVNGTVKRRNPPEPVNGTVKRRRVQ